MFIAKYSMFYVNICIGHKKLFFSANCSISISNGTLNGSSFLRDNYLHSWFFIMFWLYQLKNYFIKRVTLRIIWLNLNWQKYNGDFLTASFAHKVISVNRNYSNFLYYIILHCAEIGLMCGYWQEKITCAICINYRSKFKVHNAW